MQICCDLDFNTIQFSIVGNPSFGVPNVAYPAAIREISKRDVEILLTGSAGNSAHKPLEAVDIGIVTGINS